MQLDSLTIRKLTRGKEQKPEGGSKITRRQSESRRIKRGEVTAGDRNVLYNTVIENPIRIFRRAHLWWISGIRNPGTSILDYRARRSAVFHGEC